MTLESVNLISFILKPKYLPRVNFISVKQSNKFLTKIGELGNHLYTITLVPKHQ